MLICQDCGETFVKEDWLNLAHFKRQCLSCKTFQKNPLEALKIPYKNSLLTVYEVPIGSRYHEKASFIKPLGFWVTSLISPFIEVTACALALHYEDVFYHSGTLQLDLLEQIQQAETFSVYIIA